MCGIAGYLGPEVIDEERVDRCLALMRHRGPDASGVYRHAGPAGRHVLLLHTRLGIIDLDRRADQPMRRGDRVLVYNGEIYNHLELRERNGWTHGHLRTRCDTEVLLRVLERDGVAGLDACEGMWALALYDERDGSLLPSRDRFGEKPLDVYRSGDGLWFGSEIKQLQCLMGRSLDVNLDHVCRYLVHGYKALYKTPAGFFDEVRELRPASYLRIGADGVSDGVSDGGTYWSFRTDRDESMTYDEAVAGARDALVRSVEMRLRSDVPLAFLMSGGVDSNALIGIARRVHGFTIVNDDPRYDEREVVDAAVADLGVDHTAIPVEQGNFLDRLRGMIRHHDGPVYTISFYAEWLLMQAIGDAGYRVSVSGVGADELFSGYYDHHPVVRNPFLGDPDLFVRDPGFRDHIFLDADEIGGYLTRPWSEAFGEERYCEGVLRNRMMNELFHEAVPPILHENDLNSMSWSIENRSPFLDRELFDWCQRIPTRHLVRDGYAKALLRDAMRGIAPDAVLDEPRKVGFNASLRSCLDLDAPDVRAAVLDDGPIYDLVRRDRIETLLDRRDLPNSRSKFLFYFLNAKTFLEEFAA